MTTKAKIKEIFSSIQGEGPYIGFKQLFIRFCGCNLNCTYCDSPDIPNEDFLEFSPEELKDYINDFNLKSIHSISLTGGEPLIWHEFLAEFLPMVDSKIYLETNATLKDRIEKIIKFIHIIAADIKLPSASGIEGSFAIHDEFFKTVRKYDKEVFAKVVFDDNILDDEINHCLKLAEKYNLDLILQPKTSEDSVSINQGKMFEVLNKFLAVRPNTRLIPQVQKFLQIR